MKERKIQVVHTSEKARRSSILYNRWINLLADSLKEIC